MKLKIISKLKNKVKYIKILPFVYSEEVREAYLGSSVVGGSLIGRNILVTGGSGGIGTVLALRFLYEGCNVCISGRNEKKLKNTYKYVLRRCPNANIRYIVIDQLNKESIKEGIETLYAQGFYIDILINNSGVLTEIDKKRMFRHVTGDEFLSVWNTNFKGTVLISELVSNKMCELKMKGRIITISSICAEFKNFQYTPYGMSKAAIEKYMQLINVKYKNITTKIIQPGTVATQMNAKMIGDNIASSCNLLHHAVLPEEIAALAAFLACEMGDYIKNERITASACEVL